MQHSEKFLKRVIDLLYSKMQRAFVGDVLLDVGFIFSFVAVCWQGCCWPAATQLLFKRLVFSEVIREE